MRLSTPAPPRTSPLKLIARVCLLAAGLSGLAACRGPAPPSATREPPATQASLTGPATSGPAAGTSTPAELPPEGHGAAAGPATAPATAAIPTPAMVAAESCVSPLANVLLGPADYGSLPGSILAYLNAGGPPETLAAALEGRGAALSSFSGDIDGDQHADLVFSILDPASTRVPPAGALLVYLCQAGRYALAFEQQMAGRPRLWFLQDLEADGRVDLVASEGTCGAHTCFEEVSLWSWDGSQLANRLEGSSLDLPNPVIQILDPDGDGVYQVEVTGTGVSSAGAGPPRRQTRIWTYNLEAWGWRQSETIFEASSYRIHALYDAEDAARNGGYDQALALYQKVVADPALQEWIDPFSERANLGAYARYKMFLIYSLLGQGDLAGIVYTDLAESFPAGTPQHAYVELAEVFRDAFSQGGLASGCSAVAGRAAASAEALLAPLNGFGYSNPPFTPPDLCL